MAKSSNKTTAAAAQSKSPVILTVTISRRAAERALSIYNDPASIERQTLDGIIGPAELVEVGGGYVVQAARVEVAHG